MDGENAPPTGLLRVLAVFAALLLIAAAFGIRAIVGDGGEKDVATDNGDEVEDDDAVVLGCVTELVALCQMLQGVDQVFEVNPGGVASSINDSRIDAWVTFDPWPVAEQFGGDDLFEEQAIPFAEDPIGLVLSEPYADQLAASCGEDSLTACAAGATADSDPTGPPAELGVGDPRTALGGILLAATLTEVLGTTEFDADQIDAQGGLLAAALDSMRWDDQLGYRIGLARESRIAVLSREGEAIRFVDGDRGRQLNLEFVPTKPVIRARIVLAPVLGTDRERLEDLVDIDTGNPSILEDAGWHGPSDQPTGLPPGDVLLALAERYPS